MATELVELVRQRDEGSPSPQSSVHCAGHRSPQRPSSDGNDQKPDQYYTTQKTVHADDNDLDYQGFHALHYAVMYHKADSIRELLLQCNPSIRTKDGFTALHIAACLLPQGSSTESTGHEMIRVLLEAESDLANARDYQQRTPLHIACSTGNEQAVRELLSHIQDTGHGIVNMVDSSGNTPLHEACVLGDASIVRVLLEHSANVRAWNCQNETPLHTACKEGFVGIVEAIVDHDQSTKDLPDQVLKRSPLHYAARVNQEGVIKLLISKKCDKDMVDKDLVSPLLLSVKCGKVEAVKALIKEGCDVNTKDKDGKTTVYWAVHERHIHVLKVLLKDMIGIQLVRVPEKHLCNTPFHVAAEMGSAQAIELLVSCVDEQLCLLLQQLSDERDGSRRLQLLHKECEMKVLKLRVDHLNCRNDEHKTPLHLAAISGNLDVVRILVNKHPTLVTYKDNRANTPLHFAVIHGHTEVVRFLVRKNRISLADVANGCTPLHLATLHGRTEVVDFFIHKAADVTAAVCDTNDELVGCTALHIAAYEGHAEIVSLLIKAHAPLEAKDPRGRTSLHMAAAVNQAETASLLLDAGADHEARTAEGSTPLFLACGKGHQSVAEVLMEKGADVTAQSGEKLNCLEVAVKNGHMNVAMAMIHCKGTASTVNQNYQWREALRHSDGQMTPFRRMIQQMPSVAEAVLDNWAYLGLLSNVVKYKRDDLLKHPVVTSLLEYKWRTYGGAIFLFNLITYLIFLFFLTLYALLLPHPDHKFCEYSPKW